jgi:hypothetical protein
MKKVVVALKRFSSQVPKGATFEVPKRDADMMIAAKIAREATKDESTAFTKARKPRAGTYRTRHLQAPADK